LLSTSAGLKALRAAVPALIAVFLFARAPSPAAAQDTALEFAVKATYLYKFAPFVEWPPQTFRSATDAITLCVVGDDPFGAMLDQAVVGQHVGDRPVALRRMPMAVRGASCQIMFIAGSRAQPVADALAAVRGTPVLTVTDRSPESRAKGIVNFVIQDNRVRFEIDNQAAAQDRLAISSKLLSLAVLGRANE